MAQLVDYRGNPIKTSALKEEHATPSLVAVRNIWYDSSANNLTPERLGGIMAAVDQNDITEYLTLAEEMEERDLHYRSVLSTRKLAVAGLPLVVEASTDDATDVKIADFVREVLTDDSMINLLPDLLDALGKGYSVAETIWDTQGKQWWPQEYKWRDQRHFKYDRDTRSVLRLLDSEDMTNGVELEPFKFIQHAPRLKTGLQIRSGLARIAAIAYMIKSYGLRDWVAFAEVFGMPIRVGKYGTGASARDKDALLRAVTNIGTDAAAIMPDSMQIEFQEAAGAHGGDVLFKELLDWVDSQVSKGVLGQTMTADNGSSLGQAKIHNEVRIDILKSDALQLALTLRRDLVKPLVDLNFGPRERGMYPAVRIAYEEPEDLESFTTAITPLIDRGLRVERSIVLDKFNLPEAEEGAEVLGAKAQPAPNPDNEKVDDAPPEGDSAAPDPDGEEGETATARTKAVAALLRKVMAGASLTADQRILLNGQSVAVAAEQGTDTIDEIATNRVGNWRKVMDPMLLPVQKLARDSETYTDFLAGLAQLRDGRARSGAAEVTKEVATQTLMARGLGDDTDEI